MIITQWHVSPEENNKRLWFAGYQRAITTLRGTTPAYIAIAKTVSGVGDN